MCELLCRDCLVSPPLLGSIVHSLIKDVVIAQESIRPSHTRIVFQHAVYIELIERGECGVGLGIGDDSLVPHDAAKSAIEVETAFKSGNSIFSRDVTAIAR